MQKLTYRTRRGMTDVLTGHRKDWRGRLLFAGPAVIASVAYMDPGNYATNIQAGAGYGYDSGSGLAAAAAYLPPLIETHDIRNSVTIFSS